MLKIEDHNFTATGSLDKLMEELINLVHSAAHMLYANVSEEEHDALEAGLCHLLGEAVINAKTNESIAFENYEVTITEEGDE